MFSQVVPRFRSPAVFGLKLLLFFCGLPALASAQTGGGAQSVDEASIHSLVERFFAVCHKQAQQCTSIPWSEHSPTLSASKKNIEQDLAAGEFDLKSMTVQRIAAEGEKAVVRVVIKRAATRNGARSGAATNTANSAPNEADKLNRTLRCIKTEGSWKVGAYLSSEEDLAGSITAAKTEQERVALVNEDHALLTLGLIEALVSNARQRSEADESAICSFAERLAMSLPDKRDTATALRKIGRIYRSWFNYARAIEYHQKSLEIGEELGDKSLIGYALNSIGATLFEQGNYDQAMDYYERSLKAGKEAGDRAIIARAVHNIAAVHLDRGDLSNALPELEEALELFRTLGEEGYFAECLMTIGKIYSATGDYTRALQYLGEGLKIKEAEGDDEAASRTLYAIGSLRLSAGDFAQAFEYFRRALQLAEKVRGRTQAGLALSGMGEVHLLQGNYPLALAHFNEALAAFSESGNKQGIATVLLDMGDAHLREANYERALVEYRQSNKASEEIGDKHGIALAMTGIGCVEVALQHYESALEFFQKSLTIYNAPGEGMPVNVLDHISETYYAQRNYFSALEAANKAASIAKSLAAPKLIREAQTAVGRAESALGHFERATKAFSEAIAATEDLRQQVAGGERQRQIFFASNVSPYYAMVDLLISENDLAGALEMAERAKARVLLDVLRSGKADVTKSMTPTERDQERLLKSEIVSLNSQISNEKQREHPDDKRLGQLETRLSRARLDEEAFETTLYEAHSGLQVRRGEGKPISVRDAAEMIPDSRTALLEFVVAEDHTNLFVLTKAPYQTEPATSLKVFTLKVKQRDLAGRVESFRQRLADRRVAFHELGRSLYDLILRPCRNELVGKAKLIIIPDGVLWQLPFQALEPMPGRFVIEKSTLSYAPSLTVLREMSKLKRQRMQIDPSNTNLLAFGNPLVAAPTRVQAGAVLMDEKLLPLPDAERQVRILGKLYGATDSKVYVGAEAREQRVKEEAGSCRILHLATHAMANDASPMYSHLVLSRNAADENEDGLLEAWEIMKLDLNADLVVLSACETARGQVASGEGVIGLAWAFFVAGCPTTVVSQWKVDSSGTTDLMIEFHSRLKADSARATHPHISEGEALRLAQLKLLKTKKYQHPFYWAAFVVVGGS
jgi:CHAT domain-containing protein